MIVTWNKEKSEVRMLYMLSRTCSLEKKKKKGKHNGPTVDSQNNS